ncbi:enolase-phosphatase E1-like [Anopheles marshallii]|uniref:enolase-phosphatase E1-like n=1 Tax=Anopheles marshallii TaxID=1521116 RepID=UPI00237A1547|nr:enolase-phosphatase E1-like [Anopheles marshallii]
MAAVALSEKVLSAKSIICDIEGTTTSISFVKDILFPYALKNVEEYLKNNWNEDATKTVVAALREQAEEDKKAEVEGVTTIPAGDSEEIIPEIVKNVEWQMSQDRKTGSLKTLQGLVWAKGYKDGTIKGHVYDDVQKAFEQWTENGRKIYIYSSGSVDAQKLLFEHSEQGNLLKYLTGHYDTKVGAKREKESYESILKNIESSAEETLFLTDVYAEAAAAKDAGLNVVLLDRPGNVKLSDEERKEFTVISTFSDLSFEAGKKENGDTVSNGAKRKIEDTIEEANREEEDPAQEPPSKVTKVEVDKTKEPAENGVTGDKGPVEPSPSTELAETKSTEKMEVDGGDPVNITDAKEEKVVEKMEEDSTPVDKTEGVEKMEQDKNEEPVEETAKLNTETSEKTETVEKEIEKEDKVVEKEEPLAKDDNTSPVKVVEENDKKEEEKEVKTVVETPKDNDVVDAAVEKVEATVESVTSDPVVEEKKEEDKAKETIETEKETKKEEVTTDVVSNANVPPEEKVTDEVKKEDEKMDEVKTDHLECDKTNSITTDKEQAPKGTNEGEIGEAKAAAEVNGTATEAKVTANGSSSAGEEEKNGNDSDKENDTTVNNCEADEANAEKTNGTAATDSATNADDVTTSTEIKAKKVIEPAAVTPAPPIEAES